MQLVSYFRNVLKEVKNVNFPTKDDVKTTSIVIVVIVFVFSVFLGIADFFISKLIKMLLGIM